RTRSTDRTYGHTSLRISCRVVALALGAAQAWATRFAMNPDGVSYLDVGDAYWKHYWHELVNPYCSPLYSWIYGVYINTIKPYSNWVFPLVHLFNFLIYAGALGCFELFLTRFLKSIAISEQNDLEPWWYCFGISLFISTSLGMIGLDLVSPDV